MLRVEPKDTARVAFIPPLYWGLGFLLSLVPAALLPVTLPLPAWARITVGLALTGYAAFFLLGALRELHAARTPVNPFQPTSAIVTTGPYRYSRNPIYLGNTLLYLALTLVTGSLWPVLYLPIILLLLQRGVIEREEIYLARLFGSTYLDYKARVRRWL